MSEFPVLNFQEFIDADGEHLTTTSLKVAAVFGKRHADVLRKVDLLDCSPEYRQRNFALTFQEVPGPNGAARQERVILMTKDGFVFLVMGFTGKKSAQFKEAYIGAFNAMAALIKNQREGLAYRRAKHELECTDSKRRASNHGRGLYERKLEIPRLQAEGKELTSLSQPCLFHEAPEALQ